LESTLHVSGALYTHHQEFLKTVHAVIDTIVYRYGVRSGLLQDDQKSGACSTLHAPDDGCKEHPKHVECFPKNNEAIALSCITLVVLLIK
jgi:hypothetical protein